MKQLALIFSVILFFNCTSKQNKNGDTIIDEKSFESVQIDTLTYKVNAEDSLKCGYNINHFIYPQISGCKNTSFQKKLNQKLYGNIAPYIESIEKNIKIRNLITNNDYVPIEGGIEDVSENETNSIDISFNILNNDSVISILQIYNESWAAGSVGQTYKITNFDFKKGVFLNNEDLNCQKFNVEFLNKKIKSFFDQHFNEGKTSESLNYPFINNKSELTKLDFAIKNDSIALVVTASPIGNFFSGDGTYIIPIDKLGNR